MVPGLVRQVRSQSASASTALRNCVGDPHGVVGILARNREIGLRIPIGVVDRERDVLITLAGELDDPLDVGVRNGGCGVPP